MTRHFPSVDELREATLQALADDMDDYLATVEAALAQTTDVPRLLAELMHEFLGDRRQVHSWMALVVSTTSDPSLRFLATRWTARVLEVLSAHMDPACAVAIEIYLNGSVTHAAMHEEPLTTGELTRVLRAILDMPRTGNDAP